MANIRHMTILDARGRRARKAFAKLGIKRFFAGTAVFFCRHFFQLGKRLQTQLVRLVPVSRGLAGGFGMPCTTKRLAAEMDAARHRHAAAYSWHDPMHVADHASSGDTT